MRPIFLKITRRHLAFVEDKRGHGAVERERDQ